MLKNQGLTKLCLRAEFSGAYRAVRLYLSGRGMNGQLVVAYEPEFKEQLEAAARPAFANIQEEEAQVLFEDLWAAGFRPRENYELPARLTGEYLADLRGHYADMKGLVDRLLDRQREPAA